MGYHYNDHDNIDIRRNDENLFINREEMIKVNPVEQEDNKNFPSM